MKPRSDTRSRNCFNATRWAIALGAGAAATAAPAQGLQTYEQPPTNYSKAQPEDAISRLQGELAAGRLKLEGNGRAVVEELLRALGIPAATQLLVWSKTSLQKERISPTHPRALYYTDDCYVGWVPDGLVEIAAIDPKLGPVFYSFDPMELAKERRPSFPREPSCLECHGGTFVSGIPAVFSRSLYATAAGEPLFREGSIVVDDTTPFSDRWGGWYVTGTPEEATDRGNLFASDSGDKLRLREAPEAKGADFNGKFDTQGYLRATSDVAALMVFEYQLTLQNALTRAGIDSRRMLADQAAVEMQLGETSPNSDPEDAHFDDVKPAFDDMARAVVDVLLCKDEAALPDGVKASGDFVNGFAANAPRAPDGSSLKDLLLAGHLLRNRCGYLIYSESFRRLPGGLKRRIYARLKLALDADHPDPRYGYIGKEERARITTILRTTIPGFSKP